MRLYYIILIVVVVAVPPWINNANELLMLTYLPIFKNYSTLFLSLLQNKSAASIGQVYKGRLLKNGQTVAIKIQRPNTEEVVALDLYVLRWWGGVYNGIFRLLGRDINLQSVMDDFGNLLYAEVCI